MTVITSGDFALVDTSAALAIVSVLFDVPASCNPDGDKGDNFVGIVFNVVCLRVASTFFSATAYTNAETAAVVVFLLSSAVGVTKWFSYYKLLPSVVSVEYYTLSLSLTSYTRSPIRILSKLYHLYYTQNCA